VPLAHDDVERAVVPIIQGRIGPVRFRPMIRIGARRRRAGPHDVRRAQRVCRRVLRTVLLFAYETSVLRASSWSSMARASLSICRFSSRASLFVRGRPGRESLRQLPARGFGAEFGRVGAGT